MNKQVVGFKLAFEGIFYALGSQPNFKVHLIATVLVLILGKTLKISYLEWIVLILTITLVFTAEMVNTAIESMTDLITTEHKKQAKIAKDVAAGMVLTVVIGSIIVGFVIFFPKLLI